MKFVLCVHDYLEDIIVKFLLIPLPADGNSKLCGELVGLCGDIPTYGLPDLLEVLELINRNTKCSLAEARPLKVINHLKVL